VIHTIQNNAFERLAARLTGFARFVIRQ
jgi:hypothetical protein